MEGQQERRLVDPTELLTSAEAAQLLRVSERTVKRLLERGDLPFVRVGDRRRFIEASEVRAFIARNTRRVPA